MKILCKQYQEPRKCGGCNYETYTFYWLSGSFAQDSMQCAPCFVDGLMQAHAKIEVDK